MEYGDDYAKFAYILNGPSIFVVFVFGGFFNIVTICLLNWRRGQRFVSIDSENLPITPDSDLSDQNSNYGSLKSSYNASKKPVISSFLLWIVCSEQLLLTAALLNFSLPTMFNLFTTYYTYLIPIL